MSVRSTGGKHERLIPVKMMMLGSRWASFRSLMMHRRQVLFLRDQPGRESSTRPPLSFTCDILVYFLFLFSVINELLRRESVASYIYQFWADVVMRSPWLVTVGVNGAPKRLGHTLTCYSRGTWGPLTRFPAVQEMIISSEKSGTKSTLRWGCSWTAARVQGDKFKGLGGGGVGGSGDVGIRWHFELTSRCLTLVLTS